MSNCKYYDAENGWCKKLSDWQDSMPDIEYCVEGSCRYYEANYNTITARAMYHIGDSVFRADFYEGYYVSAGPYIIDYINIRVDSQGHRLSYGLSNDVDFSTSSEDTLFSTYEECIEWCKEQNRNL